MSVARPLQDRDPAAGPRAARAAYAGRQTLGAAAAAVLRGNDLGGRTRASATLYPHQWSWDSAFIAIGLAHLDTDRAAAELSSLFEAQWSDGRVPHIVFDPSAPAGSYVPSLDHWVCAAPTAGHDGSAPVTSGLIQP
ncbi:MAG: hypothetical protein M3276_00560, partial [Actinomycetota bacterium]|nr:hypothetical protein [Actinomycetota bacterium]